MNKITLGSSFSLLQRLLSAGTNGLPIENANRVIVVNTLSLVTAFFAGTLAYLIFLQSDDYGVLIAGVLETLLFTGFIALNYYRCYRLSALCFILTHNLALFYFAVLRGMVVEERLLLVFLIICSLLIFGPLWQIITGIGISTAILLFARINEHFGFIPITAMEASASDPFHDLGTIALVTLLIVAAGLFKKQDITLIRKLKASNENLDSQVKARTFELETANANIRFFYDQLSHDMRDKLFSLEQMNRLLQLQIQREQFDTLAFYAGRQQVAISSLLYMVSDILTLKMIESGQYREVVTEAIQLERWLKDLVSVAQYHADSRKVKIHLFVDKQLPEYIIADPVKMDKIISNLIGNAVKYTNTLVKLKVHKEGDRLHIQVMDNGNGIEAEQLPYLFDKNHTGGNGTGLGLYIVRWLCDLLGIQLRVKNSPGKGAIFYLDMPLVAGSQENYKSTRPVQPAASLLGKRVLIADDVFDNRFVLSKNLQAAGCLVMEAENGAQMLHIAAARKPDLIIMDNQMPVMSGVQALEHLRRDERLQDIRVILMTASSLQAGIDPILEADADDYISKPINMEQLKRCISRLLSSQALSNV